MKTLALFFAGLFVLSYHAQTRDERGLYIDNSGELFNGTIYNSENGTRCEASVKNGQLNGEARFFFKSGKLMEAGNFVQGQKEDKWLRYNEEGGLTGVAFYHLGKKNGTWLVYDNTGRKRFEMNYTDGQKTGIWTSWDEQGQPVETKDYSKVQ